MNWALLSVTRRVRVAVVWAVVLLVTTAGAATAGPQEALDAFISSRMETAHVPGLAAAVVHDGRVVWTGAYGLRDVDAGLEVATSTPFMLASTAKLVTATAMMHLWEDGGFALDEAIDPHLPFTVRNPSHQETPLTFRQLLMHLSSIRDNWNVLDALYVAGDSTIPLGSFLEDYLVPGGAYYHATRNYSSSAPGVRWEYSNVGFALVGYLVETISGIPFDEYCEQRIFGPLGMSQSGWHLADFPMPSAVARPHQYLDGLGTHFVWPHYGYPDYPDGQLRTSAADLASFMLLHANGGVSGGQRILQTETVEMIQTVSMPDVAPGQGLSFYWTSANGRPVVGHNGGDVGVNTDLFIDTELGSAVLVLANLGVSAADAMWEIVERLFSDALTLSVHDLLEALIDDVEDLVHQGDLNRGQGRALTAKIEAALARLDAGNTGAAANQVGAFIRQVAAFARGGVLSPFQEQTLIETAGAAQTNLDGM
jgi:CubicO group peptidase (beta-lactamase class C family)